MLAAVDVDYREEGVVAACVGFTGWRSAEPSREEVHVSALTPAGYEPGRLYLRELPYLLAVIGKLPALPSVVVVDGYVWLPEGEPGLGARLHAALNARCAVVGVAKRPYRGAPHAVEVLRGASTQPLFVTAAGMDVAEAARHVEEMHGPHRIPTLLKRVDRLCRDEPLDGG